MREPRFEQILGVRFFNGSGRDAAEYISRNGGYAVVPAAPALANIDRDQDYRRALVESDLAIADSGFMVFLWRILRRRKVVRTSGLQYLRILLDKRELRSLFARKSCIPSGNPLRRSRSGIFNRRPEADPRLGRPPLSRVAFAPGSSAESFRKTFFTGI